MIRIIVLMALLTYGQSALSDNLQAAANDVCKCLDEPYKVIKKAMVEINKAQTSGDYSKIVQAQSEMMGIVPSTTRCFEILSKKYPNIEKSDELKSKVTQIANRQCPNPAQGFLGSK